MKGLEALVFAPGDGSGGGGGEGQQDEEVVFEAGVHEGGDVGAGEELRLPAIDPFHDDTDLSRRELELGLFFVFREG